MGHVASCDFDGSPCFFRHELQSDDCGDVDIVGVDYGDEVDVAEADVVDGDEDDVLEAHTINLVILYNVGVHEDVDDGDEA